MPEVKPGPKRKDIGAQLAREGAPPPPDPGPGPASCDPGIDAWLAAWDTWSAYWDTLRRMEWEREQERLAREEWQWTVRCRAGRARAARLLRGSERGQHLALVHKMTNADAARPERSRAHLHPVGGPTKKGGETP